MAEPERAQMTIRRMRIACWLTKFTNTHPDYTIHTSFPPQQCLHEHTSMLHLYVYFLPCFLSKERPLVEEIFSDA